MGLPSHGIFAGRASQPAFGNVLSGLWPTYTLTLVKSVDKYLERIKVRKSDVTADLNTLKILQRQHLLNVPFENLDIHWQRAIRIDTSLFFDKIISERRGGFCYELNGLFNELLRDIGCQTRLVSARVFGGDKGFGPEFDHAAIIVGIGDAEYLADVGFGDFTTEPLCFVLDEEQHDPAGTFVIRRYGGDYLEVAKRDGDEWKSEYIFSDIARELSEFAGMCDFQQYSPESHFTKNKVFSVLTENGRKTLTDSKFIVTAAGERTETEVGTVERFDEILMSEFGIQRPTAAVNSGQIS
jgi:N-hydroxyarylamine O-acetyltransferase